MAEVETKIIPKVTDRISHWRYVDDTFVFVKKGCVEHVLARLNVLCIERVQIMTFI